jgi:cytochrome c
MASSPVRFLIGVVAMVALAAIRPAMAEDHPGAAIYREHCLRCHGDNGVGTPAAPAPLVGDRSVGQLTRYVADTMPEDDPTAVTGEAAAAVAEWIHGRFYSTLARDRHRPARVELARLTVGQHQNAIADLVGALSGKVGAASTDPRLWLRRTG